MSRFVRPAAVAVLADAYRHSSSPVARAILDNRHADFFPAECAAALAEVRAEAEAALILLRAEREIAELGDPELVRINALLELTDRELSELADAGLLKEFEDDPDDSP